MNGKPILHEMAMSDSFTAGEWGEPDRIRQALPVEAYTSNDWLERERRELFDRTWAFAGMTEDVAAPGDYKCIDIGNTALVLIRDPNGRLRAFHNVCRHRGARLLEGSGNIAGNVVTCFYHKWTYSLADGFALVGVPHQQAIFPTLDKSCHALHAAKVATWKNLVFVHPDPEAGGFDDWLADIPRMLGPFEPGQTAVQDPERLVEVSDVVYRVRANWKIVTENFIDGYHLPLLHAASLRDAECSKQRWRAVGRHQAFYRPIRAGVPQEKSYLGQYGDRPWPTIDGVPDTYGASYQWLFPNLGLFQTATSWSTFHVIPVEPALSFVHSRVRAVPIAAMPDEETVDPDDLPAHIVSARGRCLSDAERRQSGPPVHPLRSADVMLEDVYACEAVQRGLASSRSSVGTLSRWEAPVAFFQRQILDYVPLSS
jgi:Rieske 2Fe-2S family protein